MGIIYNGQQHTKCTYTDGKLNGEYGGARKLAKFYLYFLSLLLLFFYNMFIIIKYMIYFFLF
jgi:hypothetical protein